MPALLGLAACSQETDPGPGGVTVGEAKALDEAASMLDEQRLATQAPTEAPPADAAGTGTPAVR